MGADYDCITNGKTQRKKKKETAALGACGTVGSTLMQQLSSGGKIRGKVARLQAVIHSRAHFCQSDLSFASVVSTPHPPPARRLLLFFYKGQITTSLLDLCHQLKNWRLNVI